MWQVKDAPGKFSPGWAFRLGKQQKRLE